MYKPKKIVLPLFLFIMFISFFILSFQVFAVELRPVDNISYYRAFNFYTLQFSNDNQNKYLFNFFKSINFDIKQYLLDNSDLSPQVINDGVISFNDYYPVTSYYNNYDLYSGGDGWGVNFRIYNPTFTSFEFKNGSYQFNSGTSTIATYTHTCRIYSDSPLFDTMKVRCDLGSGTESLSGFNHVNLLSIYYQASNELFNPPSQASSPVGVPGISFPFTHPGEIFTSEQYQFLGYEYFDNNLFFGGGNPLYSGYSYFTNTFEYGPPFTNDYERLYLYGNTKCAIQPKFDPQSFVPGNYQFFIKPIDPAQVRSVDFYQFIIYKDIYSAPLNQDFRDSSSQSDAVLFKSALSKNMFSFNAEFKSVNNIMRIQISYNMLESGRGVNFYYNKTIFTSNCSLSGNDSIGRDENGNDISFLFGEVITNQPWYQDVLDLIMSFFSFLWDIILFIINLFNILISSFKTLGKYILDALSYLASLASFFSLIGTSIGYLFSVVPAQVYLAFITILTLSGLVWLVRIIF